MAQTNQINQNPPATTTTTTSSGQPESSSQSTSINPDGSEEEPNCEHQTNIRLQKRRARAARKVLFLPDEQPRSDCNNNQNMATTTTTTTTTPTTRNIMTNNTRSQSVNQLNGPRGFSSITTTTQRAQLEADILSTLLELKQLDSMLNKLAVKFRKLMNFYGLIEDVTFLMAVSDDGQQTPAPCGQNWRQTARQMLGPALNKLFWFSLALVANFLTLYVLVAHFLWELRRLDAKMNAHSFQQRQQQQQLASLATANSTSSQAPEVVAAAVAAAAAAAASTTSNGWSVLKDFLENFRRHLSRLFALATIVIWYKNCHHFELLFMDCRKCFAVFYSAGSDVFGERRRRRRKSSSLVSDLPALTVNRSSRQGGELSSWPTASINELIEARELRRHLLEAAKKFYLLASHRINVSLYYPVGQLLFNLLGIVLFPVALIVSNNGERKATIETLANVSTTTPAPMTTTVYPAEESNEGWLGPNSTANLGWEHLKSVALVGLNNFNAFHSAIHTAFHPFDHQIKFMHPTNGTTNDTIIGSHRSTTVSLYQSAVYCLAEIFVYYVYIHGPRIACTTCVSLTLALHHLCIEAFNRHLVGLIRRRRTAPLSNEDMIKLLKQYDLISMIHQRIERAFQWSLVLWFSLMFVSCLMQIFTLTESTSAAFSISRWSTSSSGAKTTTSGADQIEQNFISAPNVLASTSPVAVMLARILYMSYSPMLIYVEAFKLEAESLRTNQLIMSLARRQDDLIAQSIESSLFEPICLSVGPYFQLNKRSVASLLGAIVTFSVMFIGKSTRSGYDLCASCLSLTSSNLTSTELRTKSVMSNSAAAAAAQAAVAASGNQAAIKVVNLMGEQATDGW